MSIDCKVYGDTEFWSSGLERSADVDRFLPIANEQNASLPTTEKGQGSRVVDKTTQGSTEEIAQSLGVDNLVAPRNLNPQGFSFRVGPDICDDDDGLHNSWDMPAPPDLRALQDLHPTSLTSLQLRTSQSSTGHIFRDGSASRPPTGPGKHLGRHCLQVVF